MSYTEEQYNEFEKYMEEKYPSMFSHLNGGFAIGAGWWQIVKSLCSQIDSYTKWRNNTRVALLKDNPYGHTIPDAVEEVTVVQIKEKFGGLRFYYNGGDEHISGMVRMAESWASHTCEECGAPGQHRSGGWIRTLCDTHESERQERLKSST